MEDTLGRKLARDQRIANRRRTIQARIEAKHDPSSSGDTEKVTEEHQTPDTLDIRDNKRRVLGNSLDGTQEISTVKVQVEDNEKQRRGQESEKRKELREAILQCAEASSAAQIQIDTQWPALSNMTVPQELYAAMLDHQSACNGMLALKDSVISRMRNVLSKKEKEYMQTLKVHAEAVDDVLGRMANHADSLQQCCDSEMNLIDAALDEERQGLLKECREALNEMFREHGDEEQNFLDRYLATNEANEQRLEKLHCSASDEYNTLRRRLHVELHKLEMQLEDMRAACQIKEDQLDYNGHVLREMASENLVLLSQEKRKIAQLRDSLSGLKQRYTDGEKRSLLENQRLTADYRRSAASCSNLQAKFRRFQDSDSARLRMVQCMKEEEINQMRRQLQGINECINEEIFSILDQEIDTIMPAPGKVQKGGLHRDKEILEDAMCCDNIEEETFLHKWGRVKSTLQRHLNSSADGHVALYEGIIDGHLAGN